MITHLINLWTWLSSWSKHSFRLLTKPPATSLAATALTDMTRSRTDLIVENAMLRQQLIVLRRQVKRPKLTDGDRIRLVLLAPYGEKTSSDGNPDKAVNVCCRLREGFSDT